MSHDEECCQGGACGPEGACGPARPVALSRRRFMGMAAGGAVGAVLASPARVAAALGLSEDQLAMIPGDKGISAAQLSALADRGSPTTYRGAALQHVGMPVGGVTSGQLYLGGDGTLWLWDVYNPGSSLVGGMDWGGSHYADPLQPVSPFRQGFGLRTTAGGRSVVRSLDAAGFADVRFTGQYPIGRVAYADPESPVEVTLDAFSPFVPLEVDDSSLPATVLVYTLRNTSGTPVRAELAGWSESPVALRSRSRQPIQLRAAVFGGGGLRGVHFDAAEGDLGDPRPEIVFEDWESGTYDGWTVAGEAFGPAPVRLDEVPEYMRRFGDLGVQGDRFVTSHHFRAGGDIPQSDSYTGTLTSQPFTIERRYVNVWVGGGSWPGETAVNVVVEGAEEEPVDPRPEIVFEDWESPTYEGWTVEGEAFGAGPVAVAEAPGYMQRDGLGAVGERFVTSHHFRSGGDIAQSDAYVGKLTSRPFTIERRFANLRIGGGSWAGGTAVNAVVDGTVVATVAGRDGERMEPDLLDLREWEGRTAVLEVVDDRRGGWGHVNLDHIVFSDLPAVPLRTVVATIAGANSEAMRPQSMDVHRWEGATAHIEIVDDRSGDWAHINTDHIVFSDVPADARPLSELPDVGTFALAALEADAVAEPSLADWSDLDAVFAAEPGPTEVDGSARTIAGAVRVPVELAPGESRTVRFVVGWHFPVPPREQLFIVQDIEELKHHYAARFDTAEQVVRHVHDHRAQLEGGTRRWVDTWYGDSSLPHWLLERTLANASTLATNVCYRFDNGRFYGWEGVYCCEGTCQHVWNYAQSVARLFPSLERDTRERVDLGISYNADGGLDYRGESPHQAVAHDGQAGTILRVYREHQMSPDDAFLRRVWPRLKTAVEYLIRHDGEPDGIFEADQYNTLDQTWYGEIPWISGLYVAALRAGVEMAAEVGDRAFADRCRRLADEGSQFLATQLWNDEFGYFYQRLDPDHLGATNTNDGCYIDQMYGQTYAAQLGLPRVFPQDKARTALEHLYRYNFRPDTLEYRDEESEIPGGRLFAVEGEPGLVLCTWPFGGGEQAAGAGEPFAVGYFNEVWTGLEYQAAAQMAAEGLVEESLVVTRAVHERYDAAKRNPYNEIECSDHYSRAMMSHAVYLAMCGYEHHGPKGHLGFAPRIRPEDFRAAFTAAEGWGLYRQERRGRRQTSTVEVRHGRVRVATLALDVHGEPVNVMVRAGRGRPQRPRHATREDGRLLLTLDRPVVASVGASLEVTVVTRPVSSPDEEGGRAGRPGR